MVDANFIRQYCMPDTVINLTHLDFYIRSKCESSMNNIEKIIHSFKTHRFFIDHGWTNVKCSFDPIMSYQHLSSSHIVYIPQFSNNLTCCNDVLTFSSSTCVWINLHPSLYLFLEQFDELFPNVFCIKICTGNYNHSIDRNKARAKLVAHLISMPIQLYDLRLRNFEWLLHVIQYASDELRKDALNTVRHARFTLPSCHHGSNESIRIGEQLVPFLSTYMPHLQTLHLSRPDDFPWTSIRPDFHSNCLGVLVPRWYESLLTPESICRHTKIFKQDLCQLVEQMKEFVFLNICGKIHKEKIKPYHAMVIGRLPNSRSNVETTRFRLWL
ncbi:unnamed protein product [Rotaria sp. Silwood2]|nr:unnamed protein product [Rotaria sp. Silwood2]